MEPWESWIGRTTTTEDALDPAQANRMAALLDREPTFAAGDSLPPAWHWLFFHDVARASQLGEDGHPQLGVTMPPVPLPRRMWAAGRLEFSRPLVLGTTVRRSSTFKSIVPKEGSTGALFFVTIQHDYSTSGEPNLTEEQTIVYREAPAVAKIPIATSAPAGAAITASWSMNRTALFRYSALTSNGHRIHYDADYCRSVEGYPDVVVHGPLLATLLADLAFRNGRPLVTFSYRARSPLFVSQTFTVNGRVEGQTTHLWAASGEGGLVMDAAAGG